MNTLKNILSILILLFVFPFRPVAQIPTNGLIGYWPFNGNANDSTSNGYNGVVTGATLTTDRNGNPNAAYVFADSTQFITVADAQPLRLSNTDFTIGFWINQSAILSNQEAIISKRITGSQNGYIINITGLAAPTQGLVNYQVSAGLDPKVLSDSLVSLNAWHHVAVVYTLTGQLLRIYVDGVKNGESPAIPSPNGTTNSDLIFGIDGLTGGYSFHGKIDDIVMYDRALTPSEIYQLIAPCDSIDINNDIIARYDFAGNANDVSGNNHHGTASNATLTDDRFGNTNHAYTFNGTTSVITVPDHTSLRLNNTNFTISSWVRQNIPVVNNAAIVSKRNGSGQNGYLLNLNGSATTAPGHLNYSVSGGSDPKAVSVSVVTPNTWHHVAVSYDLSTQTMVSYVDGNLDNITGGIPTPNANTVVNMLIGSDGIGSFYFFNGKIDDIRMYSRTLNPCEIDSLFNLPDPVVSGIGNSPVGTALEVYPNPAHDLIKLEGYHDAQVTIANTFGQVVKSGMITSSNNTINISELPAGFYFIQLYVGNENVATKKIIKY